MTYFIKSFVISAFACIVIFSCSDSDELVFGDFTAEYAIPIFTSDLSLNDFVSNRVDNTTLIVDPDGQLSLNYKGSILSQGADDIFNFTAQFLPINVTDTVFHITNDDFDIPGSIDIELLDLKRGQLSLQYESNIPEDLTIHISIPQFVRDGVPYTKTINAQFDGTLPLQGSFVGADLSGYQIQGGDTLFTVQYDAILPDGNKVILPSLLLILTNLEYSYAEGFLGNDIYDIGRDTIEIDFFENWDQGIVNFEDPQIKLTAFNSFGFPLDANFFGFDIIGLEGQRLSLQSDAIDNGVVVNFPAIDQIGQTLRTDFSFTRENSNIIDVLGVGPSAVEFELVGAPNPESDLDSRGFMTDSSRIDVQLEVLLPLNGYTFGFALNDTFDVDFSNYENVQAAEFKLITESELPLGLEVDIAFADENFNVLDVVNEGGDNQLIGAAPVDANGFVTGSIIKEVIDTYDENRYQNIKGAKKILLRTEFSTTNSDIPQLVKFNASQSVKSRMGLKLEVAN